MNSLVKMLIDMGPLVVFFVVNGQAGIMAGTAAFMAATAVALAIAFALTRKLPPTPLVSGVFVLVFGGLTLWLDSEIFIKIKPTLVYGLFAAILFFGLTTRRNFLKGLFDAAIPGMSDAGWRALTARWAWFFIAMAVANEAVWRSVSTDMWLSLKLFAFLPASFVFAFMQTPLIMRESDLGKEQE